MQWKPPEEGTLKINMDGAFLHESCTGATGVVLRGSDDRFRAALARWMNSVGSTLLVEAQALRDGIWLIPEGTRDHIVVETNSLELASLRETSIRNHYDLR